MIASLARRAREVIPGGVNSPVRAMRAVGVNEPLFVRRGEGAWIEDEAGRRYVDWVMSWGPLIFGHADPETVGAVVAAAREGTSFGASTEREVELAEELVDAVPSLELVRLVSSGTEAAMSAVRLARAATRRDRILKFAGGYHGHADALLAEEIVDAVPSVEMVRLVSSGTEAAMTTLRLARAVTGREPLVRFRGGYHGHADPFLSEAGSGVRTLGIEAAAQGRVVDYDDLDGVERAIEGAACVFVEPVAGNMGVVAPADGFLDGLRRLCDDSGALLVFDEVITGFRVARGGAQERFGVLPDLTVLGKIVGGGLPLAAFGGRAELMERLAQTGAQLEAGLAQYGRVQRVGAMLTLFAQDEPVRRVEDVACACVVVVVHRAVEERQHRSDALHGPIRREA